MKMEAPSSCRRSASIYLSTWFNIPAGLNHLTGLSHNFNYHHKQLWVCASIYIALVTFHLHSHRLSQVWLPFQTEKTDLWSNCTTNCRKHLSSVPIIVYGDKIPKCICLQRQSQQILNIWSNHTCLIRPDSKDVPVMSWRHKERAEV